VAGDVLETVKGPLQVIDPHVLPAEVRATPQTRKAAMTRGLCRNYRFKISDFRSSLTTELSSHAPLKSQISNFKFEIPKC